MRLEYLLSSDDYVQFYLYLHCRTMDRLRKSRWYLPAIGLGWLALASFAFVLAFALWKGLLFYLLTLPLDDNRIFAGMAGVTAAITLAIVAFLRPWEHRFKYRVIRALRRRVRSNERKRQNFVGYRCELVIDAVEVGVTVRKEWTDNGVSHVLRFANRVPWTEVQSIEEFDMHAFILTRSSYAIFIPKAAFADVLPFRAFVQAARRYWAGEPTTAITASLSPAQTQTAIQSKPAP
ncbi:MAG TPA: YcxB family protein [Gemmataceae bacterium]|nr:YcxB family protein [Gemmataceae bacterium]